MKKFRIINSVLLLSFLVLTTFNWVIAFLPIMVFFLYKRISVLAFLLMIGFYALFYFMALPFTIYDDINSLSEIKLLLFVSILFLIISLRNNGIRRFSSLDLGDAFILFGVSLYFLAIFFGQPVFRFLDSMPYFGHYLSIYFGVSCGILLSIVPSRRAVPIILLAILNGSGTGIVCVAMVLFYRYFYSLKILFSPRIFLGAVFAVVLTGALIAGQNQRGRSIENFSSIDRVVINIASFQGLSDLSYGEFLFGVGFGNPVPILNYIEFAPIREYLEAEYDGNVYPRNLHNDYFRIFYQFGLFGLIGFLLLFYAGTTHNKPLRYGVMVAMLFNSIVFVTPLMFLLLAVLGNRADETYIKMKIFRKPKSVIN